MFAMFAVMVHYDPDIRAEAGPSPASDKKHDSPGSKKGGPPDLTALYRANLFAIDLCLIVLAQTLLITLFVKFTIPATLIATVIVVFMGLNASQRLRNETMPGFLSQFVTNRYATLSHTDMVLLIILSSLIMAFLVSALLKQGSPETQAQKPQDATPPANPPLPAP